jgi:hypothetical protein
MQLAGQTGRYISACRRPGGVPAEVRSPDAPRAGRGSARVDDRDGLPGGVDARTARRPLGADRGDALEMAIRTRQWQSPPGAGRRTAETATRCGCRSWRWPPEGPVSWYAQPPS